MGRRITRWPFAVGAASIPVLTVAAALLSLLGDAGGNESSASTQGSSTPLGQPASSFAGADVVAGDFADTALAEGGLATGGIGL